jgi:two-component system response regulator MprA
MDLARVKVGFMNGRSVLVIDDDALILESLIRLLEADGFKVVGATRGIQGCSIISTHHFDLMIVDLLLPDMSGIELIRWTRERAGLNGIPIMAISGYDRNYLVAAISAGADEGLHKPDQLDKIVDKAEKLIERSRSSADYHARSYGRAS